MADHGVFVSQQATSVSTPVLADSGIPFAIGTAPVQSAAAPGKAGIPVLCTSWDEAVEQLGYSDDWETYSLCEVMYSHFKLFASQPLILYNLLEPAEMDEEVAAQDYPVDDHQVALPLEAIASSIVVQVPGEEPESPTALVEGTDYAVRYNSDDNACIVELLGDSTSYEAETLNIAYSKVDGSGIEAADVAMAVDAVDLCMTELGVIPDLLIAPGWSGDTEVAAVMAAKAPKINGLFEGKTLIDIDSNTNRRYTEAVAVKTRNNFVDKAEVVCWPCVKLGERMYHLSTQFSGLMAEVDTGNSGIPYESPSNKNLQMDSLCLEDGTEVNLTWEQANILNSNGICTALNFMSSGWVAWGNYTACYPSNTDVKDYFIPVSRMFAWVGNTVIRTTWSKLDKPMIPRLADNIQNTFNIWLNGLTGSQYILGGRIEFLEEENPATDLMAGIMRFHIYITPPSPAQEIDFILEYDVDYLSSLFQQAA